jgi:hypothetical protein
MSLRKCSRRNCENIMCDRLSLKYGYICSDCFDELVYLGPKTDIEEFMNNTESREDTSASYKYFDAVFPPQ